MSNNSSLVQKNPIHIFFSPPKPKTTDLKRREDNFVLDCTNPLRSKLQLYQHDEDHYNQSYLSTIFTRVKTSKQNRIPQSSAQHVRPKNDKTVTGQEFKKYLSEKINCVTMTNSKSKQSEPRSYLTTAPQGERKRDILSSKHSAFIQHKFRSFKKKGRIGKNSQ